MSGRGARWTKRFSSYTKEYSAICDSGSVPDSSIVSPRETSPEMYPKRQPHHSPRACTLSRSLSLSLTMSVSLALSLSHTLSHTHTLSLSHTHSLTHSHSHTHSRRGLRWGRRYWSGSRSSALPPATRSELHGRSREWRNQAGGTPQKCTLQGISTLREPRYSSLLVAGGSALPWQTHAAAVVNFARLSTLSS